MRKRLDDVAPPPLDKQWRVQLSTGDVATDWPELGTQFPGNTREAWERMRYHPLERISTQKPLAGRLGTWQVGGAELPQWQIDVSSGARIRYRVVASG